MPHLVHLAIAQFQPKKADYRANLARLGALLAQLGGLDPRPDVLALPETALTGYFLEGGVRDVAMTAGALARDLDATYRAACGASAPPLDVMTGFYELWRNRLYNSALYVTVGGDGPRIHHVHRKVFLPTYGLFDEERFVERGRDVRAFDTPWGRAAMLVCEDLWHSMTATIAALDGAQVIFVPTAPPARGAWPKGDGIPGPSSTSRWERLARDVADEHGVYVALAHLVGSEGGKLFPGGAMLAGPRGDVRARGPIWEEALVTVTLDLRDVTRARADQPLVADLETMMPHLRESLARAERGEPHLLEYDEESVSWRGGPSAGERAAARIATEAGSLLAEARGIVSSVASAARAAVAEVRAEVRDEIVDGEGGEGPAAPATSRGAPPRAQDAGGAAQSRHHSDAGNGAPWQVVAPPREAAGCPYPLAIDPALVERWLVHFVREEMRRRNFANAIVGISGGVDSAVTAYLAARALGPEHVWGIRMPYRTSSAESLEHGQLVIDALGIHGRTFDISAAVDGYLAQEPDADATRRGNIMARMRMITLFDLSARYRAIPLGTGNKTERLFGYFTWHADDSPPINPLGDLWKTQVWALARHLGVPEPIVAKPPSADLVVGQTDEGDFGISYEKADDILNWMLAGWSPEEIVERGYDAAEVQVVRRRLAGTHWKRRLPTVAMLSPTAIGESYLRPVDY